MTLAAAGTASAASRRIEGRSALAGGVVAAAGFLVVRPTSPLRARFDMFETHAGDVVRRYDVDMTQREHMVVIADDFRSFQHLHPTLGSDGHFRIDVRVPRPGRYYVYADTEPHGLGQHVFRFTVAFGHASPRRADPGPAARTFRSLPYSASLRSLRLDARGGTMLAVSIVKHGRPADDLRPYLGGAAHAIFINGRTLAYIHVHPVGTDGAMPAMQGMAAQGPATLPAGANVAAAMQFYVPRVAPGTYRLWLEFRGADGVHVAPFVLTAR